MLKKFSFIIFKILKFFNQIFYFLTRRSFLEWLMYFLSNDSYIQKQIKNKHIKFYAPNNLISWRVRTIFDKEPDTIEWIEKFNKKDDNNFIFWDIGANIGLYSLYCSCVHGKKSKIYAFEPSTSNLRVLSRNISLNNLGQNIKIFQPALCKEENSFMMFNEHKFIEGWSMNQFSNDYNGDTSKDFEQNYKIYGTNIDSLIAQNILQVPNYIKLDVDGIEHLILQGGEKTLKNSNLRSILVEIDESLKNQLNTVMNIMKNNNFTIKVKENVLINQKSKKFNNQFNYIFERN